MLSQQKDRCFTVILIVLFFLFSDTSFGQQPVFKNFSVKDGLPSSEVYSVMQDSKGYMWFCTDAGVSRYDGYVFRNYSNRDGLTDNTVFGSYEDNKGRIWFRTMSGKLFYLRGDSICGIGANPRITEILRNGIVSSLYVDAADTIWCGMIIGKGFFKIAPPYRSSDFTFFELKQCAYIIEIDKKGFIWGALHHHLDNKDLYPGQESFLMKCSKSGELLTKLSDDGMPPGSTFLKRRSGKYMTVCLKGILSIEAREIFNIPGTHFISLFEDKSSGIWTGTGKNGMYYFPDGMKMRKPLHYLKNVSVSSIAQDSEGGFWFATLENGVYYMASPGFLYYDKENGLSENKVFAIVGTDSTHVAAGMANGDICILSKDTIRFLKENQKHLGENPIYRFYKYPGNKEVIAGAHYSFSFSFQQKHFREYFYKAKDFNSFKCFTSDRTGYLWGGNYLFLAKLDPVKKVVIESYVSESRILSLYADSENTIWAGCVNGLWSFRNGKFKYHGADNPLFKNRIDDIKVSADGTRWFATKGSGLIAQKEKKLLTIDEHAGLSSNICRSLYIEPDGTVWVGTNNGINRITMKTWGSPVVEVFSSDDGLLSNEINEVVKTGNLVWAATNLGVVEFNARTAFSNQTPPPVYITSLEINSVKRTISDSFRLKYFENYLKINFTGISYKRSSKMKYQYMLEGIDSAWSYTSSNNLQYTTLPPGAYTFIVYALNNDGIRSTKPASFYFVIAKPFWKTWWFVSLVLVLFFGSVIGGVSYRIEFLKRRAIEKSEISRKIADLKLMALKAQMNPHFIFNCIASIQHFIWKNNPEEADRFLSKFSKLIRNVLMNSTHEYITLEVEMQTLGLYIELERLRFSSKFEYNFIIDEGIDSLSLLVPPLIIQPYVENAIWHGLMHLQDKQGELLIRIGTANGFLKCVIDDNGIGRKKSMEIKGERKHRSVGLSITKERLENLNALYQSKLSVQLIDKYDDFGNGTGTTVEIYIPLNINT